MKNTETPKLHIGKHNTLRIARTVDFGVYLDGLDKGDILMPKRYVPDNVTVGDKVDAFVYLDSEDRLVATTEKPLATVGDFAYLEVKGVSRFGAFLDWGLAKDLLVPYNEQRARMEVGKRYVVHVFVDEQTQRIAATEKINRYLDNIAPRYETGDEVDVLIAERTDIGYKAIVNNLHSGLLYANETYRRLAVGDRLKAYVKKVRDDDRIDLSLQKLGYERVNPLRDAIIKKLRENGGRLAVGDKSDPETIKFLFGCSKKAFKMALGALYKEQIVNITPQGISLLIQ